MGAWGFGERDTLHSLSLGRYDIMGDWVGGWRKILKEKSVEGLTTSALLIIIDIINTFLW